MCKEEPQIIIQNPIIENMSNYIHLGHIVSLGWENQTGDISNKDISMGRLWKIKEHLEPQKYPSAPQKASIWSMRTRTASDDQCVLPVIINGAQTCTIPKKSLWKDKWLDYLWGSKKETIT